MPRPEGSTRPEPKVWLGSLPHCGLAASYGLALPKRRGALNTRKNPGWRVASDCRKYTNGRLTPGCPEYPGGWVVSDCSKYLEGRVVPHRPKYPGGSRPIARTHCSEQRRLADSSLRIRSARLQNWFQRPSLYGPLPPSSRTTLTYGAPYPKQKPQYHITAQKLISAATVVRSAPSYGLALRAAFGRTQS